MEVGGLAETFTVTGEAPLVDVTTAEIGGHISAEELNDCRRPTATTWRLSATFRAPCSFRAPSSSTTASRPTASRPRPTTSSSTAPTTPTTSADRTSAARRVRPTNRLQEVQILTNQFDAEWGRASGAVINAVTKSGTNSFTGSAFNFYTSKGMTNKDFFTKAQGLEKPDVGKKEWGGTIGGPDRPEQAALLLQPRTDLAEPELHARPSARGPSYSMSVGSEESAWNYVVAHRPSDQCEAHVGVPLAAANVRRSSTASTAIRKRSRATATRPTSTGRMVGTLTSVLSDTKVNTVRVGRRARRHRPRQPGVARARTRSSPAACRAPTARASASPRPPPRLDYDTLDIQAATTMDYSSIQRGLFDGQHVLVVHPGKDGDATT